MKGHESTATTICTSVLTHTIRRNHSEAFFELETLVATSRTHKTEAPSSNVYNITL
jgi:hypothetical protein